MFGAALTVLNANERGHLALDTNAYGHEHKQNKNLEVCAASWQTAGDGFDPSPSGLWAQHASTTLMTFGCLPLCGFSINHGSRYHANTH